MLEGCVVHAQWWCPDGCGLAPFETSLPGFPLLDGPNPLGAIRSSSSSTLSRISFFISPFISSHLLSILGLPRTCSRQKSGFVRMTQIQLELCGKVRVLQ